MGFMDRAKKLAEQAQEKLDEAQKNFNKSDSEQTEPQGDGVKYDEHGRPVQEAPPAGAAAPPAAEPTEEQPPAAAPAPPAPDPTAPIEGATGGPPAAEPTEEQPRTATPPGGDTNATPDPFKPIQ